MRPFLQHPMLLGGAAVAAVLAAMQGGVPGVPHSLDATRVFEIAALACCLVLMRKGRSPDRWTWFWGALVAVGLLSLLRGAYPALSLKELLLWTALLLAAPRLAGLGRGALYGLGAILLVLQTVWTVDLLLFWAQPYLMGDAFQPEAFTHLDAFSLFSHPRFLNHVQDWMLPVAGLLCLRLRGPIALRALCWGLLVVSWAQLWLSMGRGSMLGLTLGGVVVAVGLGREGRRFALLQGGLAAAGLALHILLFRVLARGSESFESVLDRPPTTTGRTPAWERAWEMFLDAPVLGHGPQSFAWDGVRFAHPHSTPLQLLAEWGAVGMIVIVLGIGLGVGTVVRLYRGGRFRLARRWWLVALVYSSVAGATHALVSGVLIMPLSHLGGVVVLALWFRVVGLPRSAQARIPALVVTGALVGLVLAGLLLPDASLPFFGPLSLELDSLSVQGFRRPRFWADGL